MKKWMSVMLCMLFLASSLLLISCQKKEEPAKEAAPAMEQPATGGEEQKPAESGGYGEQKPAAGGYGEEKPAEGEAH